MFDWNVAVLSIDDFYYTLAERKILAEEVHPLLRTRGVPGTHDTDMLAGYLERLQQLEDGERIACRDSTKLSMTALTSRDGPSSMARSTSSFSKGGVLAPPRSRTPNCSNR